MSKKKPTEKTENAVLTSLSNLTPTSSWSRSPRPRKRVKPQRWTSDDRAEELLEGILEDTSREAEEESRARARALSRRAERERAAREAREAERAAAIERQRADAARWRARAERVRRAHQPEPEPLPMGRPVTPEPSPEVVAAQDTVMNAAQELIELQRKQLASLQSPRPEPTTALPTPTRRRGAFIALAAAALALLLTLGAVVSGAFSSEATGDSVVTQSHYPSRTVAARVIQGERAIIGYVTVNTPETQATSKRVERDEAERPEKDEEKDETGTRYFELDTKGGDLPWAP